MTKPNLRYLSNEAIEDVAAQRIREYEAKAGVKVAFPVPVEEIIEQVLNLTLLWDAIYEQPGEMILGGLQRQSRTIVLNEKHLALFDEKPGLLRSTIGHEAGHADIEGGLGEQGPCLFGEKQDRIVHRHSTKTNQQLEVLLDLAIRNEKAYRAYKHLTAGQDTPEQKSAVDRYQSALLMPAWLMKEAAKRYDLANWKELYRFCEEAQVNISNLTTRLRRLGLIYKIDENKRIHVNEDVYRGQGTLF